MKNQFVHPGIGCSKETLKVLKRMVEEKKEPWISYYTGLLKTKYRGLDYEPQNVIRITKDSDIALFRLDCEAAWTQMIIRTVSGDERYLAVPMRIFEWYAKREDFFPKNYPDSYIKLGKYVYTMCSALDIARGDVGEEVLKGAAENALRPIVEKSLHYNGYFMNQHSYSIIGALAYSVLTDDRALYEEMVEWALCNKTAVNQGRNGALKAVIREVDTNAETGEKTSPVIELVEMGRDQDHAEGNLNNLLMMIRTMEIQGTRVNDDGEVSEGGVRPIHFLDDRLMKGFELYAKHNLGYEIDWVPTEAESVGVKVIYDSIAPEGEGNFSINGMAAAYYTYKSLGMKPEYVAEAYGARYPYFYRAAESGAFIETLHNYAFDFWTGLGEAAQDEKRDTDERKFKNISVKGKNVLSDGESATVFTTIRNGAAFRLKVWGNAKIDVISENGRTTELAVDTGGKWRKIFFDIDVARKMTVKLTGGKIELDSICEGEKIEWCDDTSVYDTYIGGEAVIDVGFDNKSKIKRIKPRAEGRFDIYETAEKGESMRVKKVTLNVSPTLAEAKEKASERYDRNAVYERESRERMEAALKGEDLREIRKAAESARLLNPYLRDGSLDYSGICKTNHDEFVMCYINKNPKIFGSIFDEDEEFIMDFGEGYEIRAEKFGIQARGGFPTRVNNSAFYGSDDGVNWTKLTKEAEISAKMQYLKNECKKSWRYIKIKRGPDNDVKVLDIGVLRIFGQRYEKA